MAGYRSCTRSRPPGWGRVLLKSHRLERGNLKKQLGDRRALALGREVGWSSMSSPGMGVKKTLDLSWIHIVRFTFVPHCLGTVPRFWHIFILENGTKG